VTPPDDRPRASDPSRFRTEEARPAGAGVRKPKARAPKPRDPKPLPRPRRPPARSAKPAPKPRTKAKPLPRPATYVFLLLVVGALTVLGLVMVLSASSVQALRNHGSSWYFFNRQILWVGLGGAALYATSRVDYRRWRTIAIPVLGVSLALMLLVLVPGVGIRVSGSSRWLGGGPFRLQPSELAKLGILLFSADLLARRHDKMHDWRATTRPVLGFYAAIALLLLAQPDLGTTLVTGSIVFAVLFLAGTPVGFMGGLGLGAAALTLVLAKVEPYRWRRMTSFLNPFADASNTGYQAAQGRIALANGGLTGVGLGSSRAKWGFLPAAHTDFIFAIVGEELGLAGSISVLLLFAAFAYLGTRAAFRAPDRFGFLLAGGITAWVLGQAVINIGAVVGLLPITGVPLPFVSSGGSSLVPMMAGLGMLLNVTRQGKAPRKAKPPADAGAGADAPKRAVGAR
jgi:cell division protein FtsW